MRAEREKVRVTFFQQSKPLEVDLPDEPVFTETDFMMASPVTLTETNHVVYNRTESGDQADPMLLLEGISQFYKIKLLFLSYVDDWPKECLAPTAKQSPIAIEKGKFIPKRIGPVQFHNYEKLLKAVVVNEGTSVALQLTKDPDEEESACPLPSITGGPLEAEYTLEKVNFHWESEHTIEGRRYPLEGHFIHYETGLENISKALKKDKGIVVLSVMYELSKCACGAFEEIADAAEDVSEEVNCLVELDNKICLRNFLPKNTTSFYTYEGSLTTPKYNEGVVWIIFDEPSRIERQQLKKLTRIMDEDGRPVASNSRALQDLNGREVFYTTGFLARIRKFLRKSSEALFGREKTEE